MATELTSKAYLLSRKINAEPQMILEIDGITELFGAIPVTKTARLDDPDLDIDNPHEFVIGGVIVSENSRAWVDLGGSTKSLTQQLSNDSTGLASFPTMKVKIIDKNQKLSEIFSPGFVVDDILAREASIYLSFEGAAHPEDSVRVISGLIDSIEFGAGNATVSVSHPENLKRQRVFPVITRTVLNELHYNSITIQDLFLRRRNQLRETLSIEYLNTTTAGNETASITGEKITVNIQSGVSTAKQVEDALRNDPYINSVLEVDISGDGDNAQTAISETAFEYTDTIDLDSAASHILPVDILSTYVRVGDEIIQYTGRTGNTLTGCVRGQLNTLPVHHEVEEEAETFYRLQENPIIMVLKLLLSNGGLPFKAGVSATRFNQVEPDVYIQNAIRFEDPNIEEKLGLVQGDTITILGATEGGNNITDRVIASFGTTNSASYIVVGGANLVDEVDSSALADFTSKYNTLPKDIGLQMTPNFVDVERHESILATFGANFPNYDLYVKEEKEGSGFINQDIYLPINLFAIPRKGKVSLNIIKPPLSDTDTKLLTKNHIVSPETIRIRRSINSKFYNAISYRYEQDSLDDKFLAGTILESENSFARIPIGLRPLTIDAPGIRKTPGIDSLLLNNAVRQILRYRYGAENFKTQVLYREGFNSDVGDTVIVDGSDLNITDTGQGNRNFQPRLMEIGNKSMDFESGKIDFELIDTGFNLDGRYGVIGPSSKLGGGSTTTLLRLKRSYGTNELTQEIVKWERYVGLDVRVRSKDLAFDETVKFLSISQTIESAIVVDPPLSLAPPEDYILDMPRYETPTVIDKALWKSAHCFATPQVSITAGVSTTRFTVGAGDIGKFQVGAFIRVHNADFTDDSGDTSISDIIGNDIVTKDDLGFTPDTTHVVELIGFSDGGKPYRII